MVEVWKVNDMLMACVLVLSHRCIYVIYKYIYI